MTERLLDRYAFESFLHKLLDMLSLEQHAQTGTRWFAQLPLRTQRIVVASAATFIALVLVIVIVRWYHHSQPGYVLEVLDGINSREELRQANDYFTPQGESVLLWGMDKRGDKPPSNEKMVYDAPSFTGNECTIAFHTPVGTGSIRLLKPDHWRFHDIYVEKLGDKEVGLWVSYMKDHPYGAWWKLHGDQMVGAFCDGLLIGAKLAK